MKKILLMAVVMVTSNLFSQTGNVGIGTSTPYSSSILDLTATDKALLLPRVANAAAVATPTNGMMVYDISQKCVIGYENSAWSGCLSSSGGGGGGGGIPAYSWETNLRFKQYETVQANTSNAYNSGGITTDNKVFFWGRDYYGNIKGDAITSGDFAHKQSPVFMDGTGKWGANPVKVQLGNDGYYVLDGSGNVWSWGAQSNGQLGDGVNGGGVTVRRTFANAFSVTKPSGVTAFTDMVMRSRTLYLLGNNGRVYYYGVNPDIGTATLTATLMPLPAGVSSVMKIWVANENSYFFYILGNNGELYSFVANKLLSGNSTIATSAATLNFFKPSKVNLPIGEAAKIIKIDTDGRTIFAVTSAGNLYAWGIVKFDYGASAGASYGTTYECMFNDQTGITIVPNEYGHRTYYAYDPKLVKLPAGETKFVDVTAAFTNNFFICVSGVGYTLGYENNSGEGGVYGTPSNGYISYTNYQKTLAIENVSAVSIRSSGFATLVLDSSGKLWGFGDNVYCMSGGGYLCPKSLFTALPLMNGNLDPNNPRPQTVN